MNFPPRIALGHYPTPIERLERLSRHLAGPEIYVKRDDQTGLAGGGNKVRKLEFLMADARSKGCDYLITMGGPQSNHCRQTAAAAAKLGMGCSVVLRGNPPSQKLGNLLLDELLGAQVVWAGDRPREEVAEDLLLALRAKGQKPYLVSIGGSTPLGSLGYVLAMQEVLQQLELLRLSIDTIVLASSSAGTQAGLVLGAKFFNYQGQILGISIDAPAKELTAQIELIAHGAAKYLTTNDKGIRQLALERFRIDVNANYLGGGYAVVGDHERNAIRTVARTEGLLLDPVYTARAMGGLMDLIHRGAFESKHRILFWHTGGVPAMSAFTESLA